MLRGNYSDLLDKELAAAVKAGIVRKDIPGLSTSARSFELSELDPTLVSALRPDCRWTSLPESTTACFSRGIAAPGQPRPSVPQPPNPRRTRTGPAVQRNPRQVRSYRG